MYGSLDSSKHSRLFAKDSRIHFRGQLQLHTAQRLLFACLLQISDPLQCLRRLAAYQKSLQHEGHAIAVQVYLVLRSLQGLVWASKLCNATAPLNLLHV